MVIGLVEVSQTVAPTTIEGLFRFRAAQSVRVYHVALVVGHGTYRVRPREELPSPPNAVRVESAIRRGVDGGFSGRKG